MTTYERLVNETPIRLTADDSYQKEAEDLLLFLEDQFDGQPFDEDPVPIHYGNVRLTKTADGYGVLVQDYKCKDLTNWISDLSYFLAIVHATQVGGKRTKSFGRMVPFRFDSPVVIANHTFDVDEWYAHRFDDETWYLAPIDQTIESQPLTGAKAYELFPDHPELYELMHLPTETIALIKGNEVLSVLNKEGEEVLTHS